MGRIFDPEGNPVGNSFQVNAGITEGPETGPKIVALPDGGFVMAYGGYSVADGGFIVVQRFNSNNQAVSERFITDSQSSLTAWEITADAVGNYSVVFERKIGSSIDIHSFTYNFSNNVRGPERTNVAQNSTEDDRLATMEAFANGHLLAFYTEPDDSLDGLYDTAEFRIIDPATGALIRNGEIYDGTFIGVPHRSVARDAAVLTGQQFVLVYTFDNHYAFSVVNTETSAGGPQVDILSSGALGGVHVVAMADGGFLIALLDAGVLYGQRYGAYGDLIGARFPIAEDVGSFAQSRLSLTSDGRILVPYRNTAGEISQVILDPRDNIIFGRDTDEFGSGGTDVLTTQITSTTIFGLGGDDTIFGQGGNDTIHGGTGKDTLDGGAGDDTYILADVSFLYFFFNAIYGYDFVIEAVGGGVDTVRVRRASDPNALGGYVLDTNVENGIIEGSTTFNLFGNALANNLTGNAAANTLSGAGGDDRLIGNGGNDTLEGGDGFDTAVFSGLRSAYQLTLNGSVLTVIGPDGTDTLTSVEGLRFDDVILTPNPPSITSNGGGATAAPTIQENTTFVTTVVATDPDSGTTLTYSISGGADAARFQINSATGALSFLSAPNFEQPADADQNNTYVVQVRAFDGGLFDDQAITVNVTDVNSSVGGSGDDVIFGDDGHDSISGAEGNDAILGQDGNDIIDGGDGNDRLNAGDGNDVVFGGAGNDEIGGGAGDDIMVGQDGDDVIFGEDGVDIANAGAGNDVMVGGLGNDTFGGGSDNDILIGGDGDDLLFGEDGADNMNGEFGADGVVGGAGDDLLGGGPGDDIVVGQDGNDVLFGETGNDAMNGDFGNDTLLGSDGNDVIGGGAGDDTLLGDFGDDTMFGENGNDLMTGGAGNDIYIGGGNDDVFVFAPGDGADTVGDFFAGGPEDRLWFAGTTLHSFGDVLGSAVTSGGNTIITYNGFFTVTLNGVMPGQLTAGDFIFT